MTLFLTLTSLLACKAPVGLDDSGADSAPVDASVELRLTLDNVSAPGALATSDGGQHDMPLAPGILVVHQPGWSLFQEGGAAADQPGLEALAEDGDPAALFEALSQVPEVLHTAVVGPVDEVTYDSLPIHPGEGTAERFFAEPGQHITVASMFGQSNDVFLSTAPGGVALWSGDQRVTGDLSAELRLWDAGTEVNQEPGLGADQAPRQSAPGAGQEEGGVVHLIGEQDAMGFTYPSAGELAAMGLEAAPE